MINLSRILQQYLQNYWSLSDLTVIYKFDEFDPVSLDLTNNQILLENLPDKKQFISKGISKLVHRVKITIFVKPVKYDSSTMYIDGVEGTIETAKEVFDAIKSEIDRIFNQYMFQIVNTKQLILDGWNDAATLQSGRGTKNFIVKGTEMKSDMQDQPIFQSEQIVGGLYYLPQSYFPLYSGFPFSLSPTQVAPEGLLT